MVTQDFDMVKQNRLTCDFRFRGERIASHAEVLTSKDWLEIHVFMKEVYLPFMNRLVDRAYERKRAQENGSKKEDS